MESEEVSNLFNMEYSYLKKIDKQLRSIGFDLEISHDEMGEVLFFNYQDKQRNRRFKMGKNFLLFTWKKDKNKDFVCDNLNQIVDYVKDGCYWKAFKKNAFEFLELNK